MNIEITLGKSNLGDLIRWNGVPNFHLLSTGRSGDGKSVEFKKMIPQVVGQGACCIVFDCTGDFAGLEGYNPSNWPVSGTTIVDVRRGGISVTPFLPQTQDETPLDISERIVDMIHSSVRLGDTQWAYLSNTIERGIQRGVLSGFSDLVRILENDEENKAIARRVLPKILKISNLIPFEDYPYDWEIKPGKLTVLDFHSIKDINAQALMVELILNEICNPRMNDMPKENVPLILVFDECQRLRFRQGSLIEKIIREGRKYGIGAWFSTQCISNIKNAEVLATVGLRIFFHPGIDNVHKAAVNLSMGNRSRVEQYEKHLINLQRGQFICTDGHKIIISETPDICAC